MTYSRTITWIMFGMYLMLLPGSTLTVALKQVPAWGVGFGALLMLLQGAATISWLISTTGKAGALAATICLILAGLIEYVGETSGLPFGSYSYTDVLQPQIAAVVPLPITFAWLMVVTGAWQIAEFGVLGFGCGVWETSRQQPRATPHPRTPSPLKTGLLAATLVVLLDLQIETVATLVNPYWIWNEHGPYYGVPTANFVSWWLVGLLMTLILSRLLCRRVVEWENRRVAADRLRIWEWIFGNIPAILYVLSTVMFTITNAAYGYWAAAGLGMVTLVVVGAVAFAK